MDSFRLGGHLHHGERLSGDLAPVTDRTFAAEFIGFNEGRIQVEDSGWPATCTFELSTRNVGGGAGGTAFAATDTHAGGYGLLTGTGYSSKTEAEPGATGLGRKSFAVKTWANGAAVDWGNPRSIVCRDAGTSKLLCAWNLVAGGAARDMSQANTTLNVTPDYLPTNPP